MEQAETLLPQLLMDWESELVEFREYFRSRSNDEKGKNRLILSLAAIANKAALMDRERGYYICGVRNDDHKVMGLDPEDSDPKLLADLLGAHTDPMVEVEDFKIVAVERIDPTLKDPAAHGVVYLITVRRIRYWPHRVYRNGKGEGKYGIYPCRYGPSVLELHKEDLATLFLAGARKYLTDTGEYPGGLSPELRRMLEGMAQRFTRAPELAAYWVSGNRKLVSSIKVEPDYLLEEVEEVDPDSSTGRILAQAEAAQARQAKSFAESFSTPGPLPPENFVEMKIALANEGSDVAVNAAAFLEFPEGCELRSRQKSTAGAITSVFPNPHYWGLLVDEETVNEAKCSADRITNGLINMGFDPIYVRFPSAGTFFVRVQCYADGMDPTATILKVEVAPKELSRKVPRPRK